MEKFDFSGWATRNDLKCSDGRIIRRDAFKHNDGQTVPLVWNHQHNDPNEILGHALLENRDEGVYAYCKFNDTESGKTGKLLVQHGDVNALSIYANKLKQQGDNVIHGAIREVSLVLSGANPGAFIDSVIVHGEESDEEAVIYTGEEIEISHSDEETEEIAHADNEPKEDKKVAEETKKPEVEEGEETVADVFNTLNEKQKTVVYAMIGQALEEAGVVDTKETEDNKEDNSMKHNVFENDEAVQKNVLSHADQVTILDMARKSNVGSLKEAMRIFSEENSLSHGLDLGDTEVLEELLPDPKLLNPGAPEILGPDQSWVMAVINKIHKSPYSRIRTRYADARLETLTKEQRTALKAKGYTNREIEKKLTEHIKLLKRSFDPQTVYIKDSVHRDDIIDITDFDIVNYIWNLMKSSMYETLALAVLIGDGRADTDEDKIQENHIRSIWNDDELYTIHTTLDLDAMKAELQGSDTGMYFGDNFVYAEAIIQQSLYAREKFKGSGTPDFYCTPHLVNVMLLARDRNGHRMYNSKADLARALNVGAIHEIEVLEGKTRTTEDGDTVGLLGLYVNLADYQFGSTKGGEITKFEDFDIDFNKYTYLMETRLSGALTKPYSAIALEIPVETGSAG